MGPAAYLRAMFTTSSTLLDMWRAAPNYHGHETTFASSRTPGYVGYSDPDAVGSGYYRSLVVKPGLTTGAVTNSVGDTGIDPTTLAVPGRASVDVPGAPLFATAVAGPDIAGDTPLLTLADGTRLKTVATALAATATAPAVIQVEGLDDPSIQGFVSASSLAPRDSRAPVLVAMDAGIARLSPNGDDRFDDVTLTGIFSETNLSWTVAVRNAAGDVVDTTNGTGQTLAATWDGLADGVRVPDGSYTWTVTGTDAWQNTATTVGGSLVVDTTAPILSSSSAKVTGLFSPDGDGVADSLATAIVSTEAGTLSAWVTDSHGATIRSWTATAKAGSNTVTWDGRNGSGAVVAHGSYALHVFVRDGVGNQAATLNRAVRVVRLLGTVNTVGKVVFGSGR
jgi:flagellar hook assembly protein FlgD